MKHIGFAVIAAAVLAIVGPRISQGNAQPHEAAAAPHELLAPSDYRAVTPLDPMRASRTGEQNTSESSRR